MAEEPKVFDSAMKRLQLSRYGDIVLLVMPGEGAILVPGADFSVAQKWAQRRHSTGSPMRDRALFLDRFDTVVARSGSLVSTRGSRKPLEGLVRAMRSAGLSPDEWSLPADLKARPKPGEAARRTCETPQEPGEAPLEPDQPD